MNKISHIANVCRWLFQWPLPGLVWLCIVVSVGTAGAQVTGTEILASEDTSARGLIRSSSRIEYRTELQAPVLKTPVLEGQSFEQGDLLIELDCSGFEAERRAAKAAANAAGIESNTKRILYRRQAAGRGEYDLARALAERANAEHEVLAVRNQKCSFLAPFTGRVVALNSQVHEYPPRDRPLITIINDSRLELEMVVPSQWLVWLKTGTGLQFLVDETGAKLSAKIVRMGAEVDPVSQTIKVIAAFDREGLNVLAGMSGTAYFAAFSG